jgi:hypothetical protein
VFAKILYSFTDEGSRGQGVESGRKFRVWFRKTPEKGMYGGMPEIAEI